MDINLGDNSSAVSNVLLQLAENEISETKSFMLDEENNSVGVRITAEDIDALIPFLNNLGFEILASSPEHHLIEGYIPFDNLSNLETLAGEGLLMGVLPLYQSFTRIGDTDSQADFVLEADRVRHALPTSFDGTGQTVAVFSDSFDVSSNGSATTDIASGDLPGPGNPFGRTTPVNVLLEGDPGDSDEGRAMLQLVHDLAPGADLVFAAFSSPTVAAQQIRNAADPTMGNAHVLVDDIGFFFEPFFQDGLVAQAVDDVVVNDGVTYFSAAGNDSDDSYESTNINFTADSGGSVSGFPDPFYYDFDSTAGVDTRQEITLDDDQSFTAVLQWDDPWFTMAGVDTDMTFALIDSSNNIVGGTNFNNIGNQTPAEIIDFTNTTGATQTYEVVIIKNSGPDPSRIKYISFGTYNPTEFDTQSSTVFGHPAATNTQAVAAIPFFLQDTPEDFTSEGPTTILFEPDGTPLAVPEVRPTPDIAAIDDTNTTFFISDSTLGGSLDVDLFPNFPGTSAAAPHAAAVAALVQQANPGFTPQQVYNLLQSTAEDIAPAGFDNVTGNGLINAFDAVFGPVVPATLPFTEDFEDGDLPIAFETNSNVAGRIQVTSDFNPIGNNHVTLDSSGLLSDSFSSLNELILHFDSTGFSNITLSFDQKEFEDENNPMSATFSGSENSDGVALSVDGTNWFRLVDLTGSNSTSAFQTNVVDISAVAADKGLTLGSDVQIKFQQFDNFPLTGTPGGTDGFAFDNITVECFLTGTRILTEQGEIPVEHLKIGDLVQTADGNLEPIKWIGKQTIHPHQVKNPLRGYPVLIKAGALGNNLPHRDLYVSPDHSMFVDGLLINAGALVNDISIIKTEPTETFTYYHVELENHSLLVAEGTAAESYLPQKENREEYDNFAEYEELYPQGNNLMLWPMDYPRISSWNKVPRFVSKKLLKIAHHLTEHRVEISA